MIVLRRCESFSQRRFAVCRYNTHSMIEYLPPPDTGLQIPYVDDHLVVLNKPAGLLSVPGRGPERADCLLSRAERELGPLYVVHRLDMATSGLMLLARTKQAQSVLGRRFQVRQVDKCYVAVVAGSPPDDAGEVDLPLITDWPNRPRQKVDYETGKPALTRYRVLERGATSSRVQLEPHTGRSHQLRVHMQQLGCPILGDELYADPAAQGASERLLLHAMRLRLQHPLNDTWLDIHVPAEF